MEDPISRTWLCSVVFLDIVGYSKRRVADQLLVKQHLSELIKHALMGIREDDVIVLDSGDGAAICFLADPVEALYCGLSLHSSMHGKSPDAPQYSCRMGINLGPVKVINDVNGRRNTVGDGINSAQRVMDFAEPNQLLVSRSFHDVIACLSEEYNNLFSYLGIRHDKHVKEYDIYEVSTPAEELVYRRPELPSESAAAQVIEPVQQLGPIWDDGVLDQATKALAARIGPMAKVLVKRAARQACSPQDFYEMLAKHLPDPSLRDLFLKAMSGHGGHGGNTDVRPRPDPVPPGRAGAAVNFEVPEGIREPLRHRLAESQGPLAKVLLKRAAAKAADYPEFCRLLARELAEDEREAFVAYAVSLADSND